ncbi:MULTISPECIES: hypothetical protein [unclassified Microbacterium]|uniref:hypothetical protein n=1 Tax=unclassified Microbacterium TaxID=2609290 RepID=UPI0028834FF4|nr:MULTISPECIES: hypothetical protein [unclassified Microbacterium]
MAHSDRDQRGRPRSGKHPKNCGAHGGCPSCGQGEYKPMHRRLVRHQQRARIAEQLA